MRVSPTAERKSKVQYIEEKSSESTSKLRRPSVGHVSYIVFFTLPLVLATADNGMDFVLNAFAATFIVDLDDLPGDAAEIILKAAGYTELEEQGEEGTELGETSHV